MHSPIQGRPPSHVNRYVCRERCLVRGKEGISWGTKNVGRGRTFHRQSNILDKVCHVPVHLPIVGIHLASEWNTIGGGNASQRKTNDRPSITRPSAKLAQPLPGTRCPRHQYRERDGLLNFQVVVIVNFGHGGGVEPQIVLVEYPHHALRSRLFAPPVPQNKKTHRWGGEHI